MPQIQQPPPNTGPSLSSQVAPWMTTNGAGGAPAAIHTSFYNDSSDNLSVASQLSPGFRIPGGRPSISQPSGVGADNNEASYFGDERRPSIASITTTASSQGSKASGNRGGFRKLQGFFGEEFPGRDSSDTSLPPAVPGKEHRSHSYSHGRPYRDRNYSNATDHTRDGSPSSSRPRTPVPAPEVVPFLYQEADVCSRRLFYPPSSLSHVQPPPFCLHTLGNARIHVLSSYPSGTCLPSTCNPCVRIPPLLQAVEHGGKKVRSLTRVGHCKIWRSSCQGYPVRPRS